MSPNVVELLSVKSYRLVIIMKYDGGLVLSKNPDQNCHFFQITPQIISITRPNRSPATPR
jgi:hypothetical protein